jgi:hypothetical protein
MSEARMHVRDCGCLDATSLSGPVLLDPRCLALDGGPDPDPEPFDFGSIRLRPYEHGHLMLIADCLHPTCGWRMTFSTWRMDLIIDTCRDHPCRRLCSCGQAERVAPVTPACSA